MGGCDHFTAKYAMTAKKNKNLCVLCGLSGSFRKVLRLFPCVFDHGGGNTSHGLTCEEAERISKCKWGPLEFPVLPMSPIKFPCPTL